MQFHTVSIETIIDLPCFLGGCADRMAVFSSLSISVTYQDTFLTEIGEEAQSVCSEDTLKIKSGICEESSTGKREFCFWL